VAAKEQKARKGGGRRPAPEHLPIVRIEIDLPEAEKVGLVRIREEITEELDYEPGRFIRRHYVRFVYADPRKQVAPKLPQLPPRVIPQASVGVVLMVHLLVSKYTDHVPLYRLEQIAARVGVELPRQKLCRWVEQAALLLRTIYDRLRDRILTSGYVQADQTPVKVLDPDRGGHAAQAYLWTYLSPLSQAIVFDFDLSRSRENLREFFPPDWQGVLQSDGYEAYESFLRDKRDIVHVGCMAHLRRYVVDALEAGAHLDIVARLLADIGLLYRIETQARAQGLSHEERTVLRQRESTSVLERLHQQFLLTAQNELPQSSLGKAAAYALARWQTLTRYADTRMGHVLIDQNSVERGIRPTKLGAKNWLYIGHPDAGWRSAVIYSITGTLQAPEGQPGRLLELGVAAPGRGHQRPGPRTSPARLRGHDRHRVTSPTYQGCNPPTTLWPLRRLRSSCIRFGSFGANANPSRAPAAGQLPVARCRKLSRCGRGGTPPVGISSPTRTNSRGTRRVSFQELCT
jgi:transposase